MLRIISISTAVILMHVSMLSFAAKSAQCTGPDGTYYYKCCKNDYWPVDLWVQVPQADAGCYMVNAVEAEGCNIINTDFFEDKQVCPVEKLKIQ